MMRRTSQMVLAAMLLWLSTGSAHAEDWFKEFTKNSAITARRVNHWPQPFIYPDRRAVVAPFSLMVSKGWKAQNTVGAHLFDDKTGELKEAGKLKIRSIVADTPLAYRSIYVQTGASRDETTRRVDLVQQYAVHLVPRGPLPPVRITDQAPRLHEAEYVDSINRRFTATTPSPRLPDNGSNSSGEEK